MRIQLVISSWWIVQPQSFKILLLFVRTLKGCWPVATCSLVEGGIGMLKGSACARQGCLPENESTAGCFNPLIFKCEITSTKYCSGTCSELWAHPYKDQGSLHTLHHLLETYYNMAQENQLQDIFISEPACLLNESQQ